MYWGKKRCIFSVNFFSRTELLLLQLYDDYSEMQQCVLFCVEE